MCKKLCKLLGWLIALLLVWSIYERSQWVVDFQVYDAPVLNLGPLDQTYIEQFNPSLFDKATVYYDSERLKYPEDIAVSSDGVIYCGLADGSGSLVAITPNGQITKLYEHKGVGMILGIIITDDDSTLYYVSEFGGLIKFDLLSKKPTVLLSEFEGKKLPALNGLCIDEQKQIIYMTDCTSFPLKFAGKDLLLKRKGGRILAYNLKKKKASVVLDELAYPNGIVFDKSSQSIIFSEVTHHTISKFFPYRNNSQKQTVIGNLFGYPDNLKLNQQGELYVGIPGVRDPSVEYLFGEPDLRKKLMYVPEQILVGLFQPKIALGIKINLKSGSISDYFFGPTDQIYFVTTILQKKGKLYFSSLKNPTVVVIDKNIIKSKGNQQL